LASERARLLAVTRAPVLLGAAAASLVVAQALLPAVPSESSDQVVYFAAHRTSATLAAAVFLLAAACLVLGTAASAGAVVGRGRILGRIGLVLTGIGALWPAAGRATFDLVMVALTGELHGRAAVDAASAITNSAALALLLVTLLAFVLGPALLVAGLWRAGVGSWPPAVLWLVGVLVVNATDTSSAVGSVVGMLLAAAALAWIGIGVRRAAPD
jgi:hypothetical protein